MRRHVRTYVRAQKVPLFKVTQHLSDARDDGEIYCASRGVYCRRKAVITMLNERFVALYSDDISPVTDCDGLASVSRSSRRPLRTRRDASDDGEMMTVRHLVHSARLCQCAVTRIIYSYVAKSSHSGENIPFYGALISLDRETAKIIKIPG